MNYPMSNQLISGVTLIPGLSNFKKQDSVKSNSYYNNISEFRLMPNKKLIKSL